MTCICLLLLQQLINISCPWGPQQQTCSSGVWQTDGTDRQSSHSCIDLAVDTMQSGLIFFKWVITKAHVHMVLMTNLSMRRCIEQPTLNVKYRLTPTHHQHTTHTHCNDTVIEWSGSDLHDGPAATTATPSSPASCVVLASSGFTRL